MFTSGFLNELGYTVQQIFNCCHGVVLSDSFAVPRQVMVPCSPWMPWLVCLSAGLFFLYEFFQLNVFDVINQPLRDEFHIDSAQLSWMSSAYVWANVLFLLPAGVILDRFSARRVILGAMALCVLGTVGFAQSHTYFWAFLFHAFTGVGNAFCFLSCVVLVSRWFPPQKQALVIGCIVTMAFIGGMLAHAPLAYLYAHYGWRQALLIDSSVGAAIFVWIVCVVADRPRTDDACVGVMRASYFSGFVQVLKHPQNWLAGLYTACLNLPIMVLCALWGASFLQTVHHLTPLVASHVVSLIFVGSIIGCPLVGLLSDRLGRRKPLMILGAVATVLTVLPLVLDVALSVSLLSVLFFALGLFTSTQVITYPLVAESNPAENTGVATGLASVIIMGGGGAGQILFGLLMRQHADSAMTSDTIAQFQSALWMFPLAGIVAFVAVLLIHETYCGRSKKRDDA